VGFVDLNEQALPAIAAGHDVRVVRYDRPTSRSLRTLSSYLGTLREYHRRHAGPRSPADQGRHETWQKTFGIIESGAMVHESAVLHDSVVLAGARVEANAVLVRSVVCPGVWVGRGQSEVDCVVGGRINGKALPKGNTL
jgi:ADP-glucose pyrophosphorylase